MSWLRGKAVLALAVPLVAAGALGCGSDRSSPVVLRVGAAAINRTTVDHWARAIALGSTVDGALGQSSATSRQKALEFLISANWAIGAAAEHGLAVSEGAVARGLQERIAAVTDRPTEFEEEISATGQTLTDVKLEVKAALAAAALRRHVSRRTPLATDAEITSYYRRHLQSFRIPQRRLVDLIEYIDGYAHAVALGKRLGPGKRFAKKGMRELVPRQTPYEDAHRENGRMVRAIFATSPGRVGGPVMFHGKWVLLVVRKHLPARVRPLSAVRAQISERLSEERRRAALASFFAAYRREWSAKTHCAAGFVVQRCIEYRGRLAPVGDLLGTD